MQLFLDMLSNVFVSVFNMSITASVIIAFVFIARFCLRRMPRGFSYALWAVVLFRLLCPISFELPIAALSLTGASPADETQLSTMQYIQADWTLQQDNTNSTVDASVGMNDAISTSNASDGVGLVTNESTTATTQDTEIVGDRVQGLSFHILAVVSVIWLLGAVGLFGANCFSLLRLKKKLHPALRHGGEMHTALAKTTIYQSDAIPTAFVLGVLRPRIYLPAHLTMKEQSYILLHEQTHIARLDPLWQALAFFALCLHWFNPLVWLAFKANQKDMELSCDERVLRQMGSDIKKEYAQSLLNLSQGKNAPLHHVLAFGESSAKSRIKNVLSYRKPVFWVSTAASLILVAVAILLVANPLSNLEDELQATSNASTTANSLADSATAVTEQTADTPTEESNTENTDTQGWDDVLEDWQHAYVQYVGDADGDGVDEIFAFVTSLSVTARETTSCEFWWYHNGTYEKITEVEVCDLAVYPEDATALSPQWIDSAVGRAFCFVSVSGTQTLWNTYTVQDGEVIAADPVTMALSQEDLADYFINAIITDYGENAPSVSRNAMLTQTDLDNDGNPELWMMLGTYNAAMAYVFELQEDGTANLAGRLSNLPDDTQVLADTALYEGQATDVLYMIGVDSHAMYEGEYITEYFFGMENDALTFAFLDSSIGFVDAENPEDTYHLSTLEGSTALTQAEYEAQKAEYLQGASGSAQGFITVTDYAEGDSLALALQTFISG